MKIAIGSNIINSAWGGGNNFVKNISNYLINKGHKVFYNLTPNDLDIILLTDPRVESSTSTINHLDINNYLKKNYNTIVIHRVNECDERKNTTGVNKQLIFANKFCDYTVFISEWLQKIFKKEITSDQKVILNGANKEIFNFGSCNYENNTVFKIVTHHWSNHKNKGFEIYKYLDQKLSIKNYKDKIKFSIIGNIPKDYNFVNTELINPLFEKKLSNALNENHAYITGSINEPGGNHQNEAINCGLPVLYINSGCMKEYCDGYGLEYNKDDVFEKINQLIRNHSFYRNKCKNYNLDSNFMCKKYLDLFIELSKNKKFFLNKRKHPKVNLINKYKYILRKIIH